MRSPPPAPPLALAIAALLLLALLHSGEIRGRAVAGLGVGMQAREAALARGFVLGEDAAIDPRTVEDFRRSGLSHLLAVSGQNVTLLALLAMPLLAALGVPLRDRLLWILALIVLYVSLAGAEPSIQRAAVMGAVGVLATLAGRRGSRAFALAAAAAVTLAVDPGIAADVGWQLSFAAVVGILLLATPFRAALGGGRGPLGRALVEGAAVTVAATLATAPLVAFHFGAVSATTVLANLLALPAVAPAMWLGMAGAAAAQVPGMPLEILNVPNALLLGYIAQVAAWCAAPEWAELEVHLGSAGLGASYAALATVALAVNVVSRQRPLRGSFRTQYVRKEPRAGIRVGWVAALVLATVLVATATVVPWGGDGRARPAPGLRITVLDVGQGDAILLRPRGADPVLVDAGPAGAGLPRRLEQLGVDRLGALVLTHDQSDHAGGIDELLGRLPIGRFLHARAGRELVSRLRAAGARPRRIGAGARLRAGQLRLRVLWPPPELLGPASRGEDPNRLALVVLARWRDFSMLLAADAEAEAVPLDPGPVDVLKVAHHGSEDAGLAALLARTRPRLAVISAGAGNPYGHPAAATTATLAASGMEVLRTDRDGEIGIEVGRRSFVVAADR